MHQYQSTGGTPQEKSIDFLTGVLEIEIQLGRSLPRRQELRGQHETSDSNDNMTKTIQATQATLTMHLHHSGHKSRCSRQFKALQETFLLSGIGWRQVVP